MGRYAGLGSINVNKGGVYFDEGQHVVKIIKTSDKKDRNGVDMFIVEAKILETTGGLSVGTTASQVIKLTPNDYLNLQLADIKQYSGAVLEIDPEEYQEEPQNGEDQEQANDRFWDDATEALVSTDNPTAGLIIRLTGVNKEKKNSEGSFTKLIWGDVLPGDWAPKGASNG